MEATKLNSPRHKADHNAEQAGKTSSSNSGPGSKSSFLRSQLDWAKGQGLIPAIVQDERSGRVLMLGFMSPEAFDETLASGLVTFFSRSEKRLWTKGETSGHYLKLKEIRPDCDQDTLLIVAEPQGPTCHRGTVSCFGEDRRFTALEFLSYLEALIQERKKAMPRGSYTSALFTKGLAEIAKKLGEEAVEVVVSAGQERTRSVEEAADLLYHLLIFLAEREIALKEVVGELEQRHR